MKSFATIFGLISIFFLSGCASMQPSPYNVSKLDFPEMNIEKTAEVGDRLVQQGMVKTFQGIKATSDGKCLNFLGAGPVIALGQTFQKFTKGDATLFCGKTALFSPYVEGTSQYLFDVCLEANDKGGFAPEAGGDCSNEFETGQFNTTSAENFQRTFYYKGKSGNEIYFDYKEFVNDMARPAFTQELIFDLNESDIVGFRGMRLQVLSATNTQIKYRVLQNFADR